MGISFIASEFPRFGYGFAAMCFKKRAKTECHEAMRRLLCVERAQMRFARACAKEGSVQAKPIGSCGCLSSTLARGRALGCQGLRIRHALRDFERLTVTESL